MIADAIVQGIGFGLSAGAIPGPLQTFLFLQTLKQGASRTLPLATAPLWSDGPIIALMVLILGQVGDLFISMIGLMGAIFILYLARGVYLQIRAGGFSLTADIESAIDTGHWVKELRQLVLINVFNPNPWIFWGTVTGPLLVAYWQDSFLTAIVFLCAFYGSFIGLVVILILIFHQTRLMGEQVVNLLLRVGVVILVVFALLLLQRSIQGLI